MYRVRLTDFEGPLDLLLFFIKRDELDIYNIPIAKITREFLEYIHLMASLDLEVAGEFIVMAATLMQIKVRMLLPREETEGEEEDPRAELVRRLIEYKRYKEKALEFSAMEDRQRQVHYRKFFHADSRIHLTEDSEDSLQEISLFNLIAAYKTALDQIPKKAIHEVTMLNVSVDEQTSFVMDFLRVHGPTSVLRLVSHMTEKIRVIVTVIALLELAKNRIITLGRMDSSDDIDIRLTAPLLSLAGTDA